ncbi:MAG: hypothetical protein IJQ39_13200 [Thermoguttaceae bacterium]|nr:hypothetical protein [Thermoguttaceae bacterium]
MAKQVNKLICGIASLIIPGLGQLLGGRVQSAIFWFLLILILGALLPYVIIPYLGNLGSIILVIAWILNILDAIR